MQITIPVNTFATFTLEPDPRHPTYIVISLLGFPVAGMWHHGEVTGIERLDPANPENDLPGFDLWIKGPDEAQRTTEALRQLAACLFTVPA